MAKKEAPQKMSGSLFDSSWTAEAYSQVGADEQAVKRLSIWAIVAVVIGVLSLLAFMHIAFSIFSIIAGLFAVLAFIAVGKSGGEISGRSFACIALALSLITFIGGSLRRDVYRMEFERQAAEFCDVWFEAAKKGDVCQLRQMTNPHWNRATVLTPQDEVNYFVRDMAGDEEPHHGAHSFLANPTLLTLHALGDRARHSYYATTATLLTANTESTERVYAVTREPDPNDPESKKQTFFIRLVCNRVSAETEEGEKLVGWSTIVSDLAPMKLDEDGRPTWESQNR